MVEPVGGLDERRAFVGAGIGDADAVGGGAIMNGLIQHGGAGALQETRWLAGSWLQRKRAEAQRLGLRRVAPAALGGKGGRFGHAGALAGAQANELGPTGGQPGAGDLQTGERERGG